MRLLDGLRLLLVVTIDVVVAAAVVSLRILWSILITAELCDVGWRGEAVVLEAGPHPGGRKDRGDSLLGRSQWWEEPHEFPGRGRGSQFFSLPGG